MEFTIVPAPAPWVTPLVRARLEKLGPGTMIDRAGVHALIKAPRAADQFLYNCLDRGLLVPISWGRALVPQTKTLDLLAMVPDRAWARIISHAQTIPRNLGSDHSLLGFMAPVLVGIVESDRMQSAPVYDLAGATTMPDPPLRKEAFHIDAIGGPPRGALVHVGTRSVEIPMPSMADVVRILQSTLEPRLLRLASEMLKTASDRDRRALRETKPRWGIPGPVPSTGSGLPTGPPQNLRLFGPGWYVEVVRGVQEALARRRLLRA